MALLPEIDSDLINNDNELMEEDASCGNGMGGITESSDNDENESIKGKQKMKVRSYSFLASTLS